MITQSYIHAGQEVRVPAKFGDAIVEVLGITPGAVLIDLLGTGASAVTVPLEEVRDLDGRPLRQISPRAGKIFR